MRLCSEESHADVAANAANEPDRRLLPYRREPGGTPFVPYDMNRNKAGSADMGCCTTNAVIFEETLRIKSHNFCRGELLPFGKITMLGCGYANGKRNRYSRRIRMVRG